MTDKIAIIGFGNIASAIITPLLDNKLIQPENIFCVVNSEKSLELIKKNYQYNINAYKSSSKESKIIWDCQYKLLSVKPQHLDEIAEVDIGNNKENLIISILAGVSINRLTQKFPNHKCVRVVTNIPSPEEASPSNVATQNTPKYSLENNTAPQPAWGNSKLSAFS